MEKEKYQTTKKIMARFEYLSGLQTYLEVITQPRIFGKMTPVSEVLELIKLVAEAKAALWSEVYREFPVLIGNQDISIFRHEITYEVSTPPKE